MCFVVDVMASHALACFACLHAHCLKQPHSLELFSCADLALAVLRYLGGVAVILRFVSLRSQLAGITMHAG
jgi:hypothetical protein